MKLITDLKLVALVHFFPLAEAFTFAPIGTYSRSTQLAAREPKKSIEERRMERENEILEMGGDPFFLTDEMLENESEEEEVEADMDMPSMSLLGAANIGGGVTGLINQDEGKEEVEEEPKNVEFLWDGEVDDSAYFD